MSYFDAASSAPPHPVARQALLASLDEGWADPARLYREGRRAGMLLDAAREAAAEAVQRAREGGGPSVIEASAIRFYGHFEGDAGLYRTPEQLQTYKDERDPLKIFRENTEGVIDPSEAATTEVDEAVAYARAAAWPAPSQVLTDVYKTY